FLVVGVVGEVLVHDVNARVLRLKLLDEFIDERDLALEEVLPVRDGDQLLTGPQAGHGQEHDRSHRYGETRSHDITSGPGCTLLRRCGAPFPVIASRIAAKQSRS